MKKRKRNPGSGSLQRKRQKSNTAVECDTNTPRMLHKLNASDVRDCQFGIRFATGVKDEMRKIMKAEEAKRASNQKDTDAMNSKKPRREQGNAQDESSPKDGLMKRSVYGYFGKSSLLVEAIDPTKRNTSSSHRDGCGWLW